MRLFARSFRTILWRDTSDKRIARTCLVSTFAKARLNTSSYESLKTTKNTDKDYSVSPDKLEEQLQGELCTEELDRVAGGRDIVGLPDPPPPPPPIRTVELSRPSYLAESHSVIARAPMRIGLAGGGTDVPPIVDELGGTTLTASIDMYATCRVESSDGQSTTIANDCNGTRLRFASSSVPVDLECTLPGAAYLYSMQKWNQGSLAPMEIRVSSDVAVGSGMGGSSAMTVAMLLALSRFLNVELEKNAISRMAHAIEFKQLGVLAGTQDSIASTHGGIQFVEHFRSDNSLISNVEIDKDFRSVLENSFILANPQVSRLSTQSHGQQCLQYRQLASFVDRVVSDLRGVARAMKHALELADLEAVGHLFKQACHLKTLLNPAACLETVGIRQQEVEESGAIAMKLCGAGNGGYVLAMARPECYDSVWKFLATRIGSVRSIVFVDEGAQQCDAH